MDLKECILDEINAKTKPQGSLGKLEEIALKIALTLRTKRPAIKDPHILVFAGDHGLAAEKVSAYPKEVTAQMVLNFLAGGAAINVFCRQHSIRLKVIDAGVDFHFDSHPDLIDAKVGSGTRNIMHSAAMSVDEFAKAEYFGKSTVLGIVEKGCNVIGFGEMGIGNTSSSSLILSALYKLPIEEVVGRGTGLDDVQFQHKIQVLKQVLLKHEGTYTSGEDILRIFGGFEIVQMYSAMRETARHHMVLLVDGYIATAAFCVAYAEDKSLMDKAIFCHQSDEFAHSGILKKLKVKPLLNLGLRLGEGTGCALAFPLIESAIRFLNEMHTFQDAKVSEKI